MTTISKKELAQRVAKSIKIPQTQAETIISEFLEQTKQALIKGGEIRLIGYFSLKTTLQKARIAMNLQTKKKMKIPAKIVPKCKFSSSLKEEIAKKKVK